MSLNFPFTRCPAKALTMMVVLEIAISAPAKMLSSLVQPKSRPVP
jgi:hypothetical protein